MDFNDEISQLILESDKDETCRHSSHQIESWMLDYEYVAKCQDVSTLKGILKILISGREGRYPDLEKTVEKKILSLLPEKESNRIKKSSAALCRSGTKKDDRDGDSHFFSSYSGSCTTTTATTRRTRREEEQLDATNDVVQWAELMGCKERDYSSYSASDGDSDVVVLLKEFTSTSRGGGEEEKALNTSSSSFVSSSSSAKHTIEVPIRAKVVTFYGTRKTTSTDHDFMKRNNNKKYISTNSDRKNSGIPSAEQLVETSAIRQKKQGENLSLFGGKKKTNPVERICKERLSNRDYFRAWDKFNVEAAEAALDRSTSTDSSDDDDDDDLKLENLVYGNHRNGHATKTNSNLVTVIREEDYHTMDSDDEEEGSRLVDTCFLERLKSLSRDERKFMAIREKEKGNECYRLKQYETAMDHYSKSIAFDGENAVVYANRAVACIRNGKKNLLAWALDDCNKALEIDPEYIKALARRGKIYQMNGQYQDALRDFANCIRKEPGNEEYEKLWMEARNKHCPPHKEECDEQSKRRNVIIEEEDEDDESEHEERDVVEEIYTPGCSRKS